MSACALCGTPAPPPFRAPQQEGSPDLDGRPGEPARSTLRRWVQTCGGCGACAPDLTRLAPDALERVHTAEYRGLRSPFLRWADLAVEPATRAEALLQAAWAVEDEGGDASPLRRRAAAGWPVPADPEAILRLADIQRRAGLLDQAADTLRLLPSGNGDLGRIVAFERARVAAGDTGRHMLSSALRPPARMPHVAHGKPASAGFWGRLLGGRR